MECILKQHPGRVSSFVESSVLHREIHQAQRGSSLVAGLPMHCQATLNLPILSEITSAHWPMNQSYGVLYSVCYSTSLGYGQILWCVVQRMLQYLTRLWTDSMVCCTAYVTVPHWSMVCCTAYLFGLLYEDCELRLQLAHKLCPLLLLPSQTGQNEGEKRPMVQQRHTAIIVQRLT